MATTNMQARIRYKCVSKSPGPLDRYPTVDVNCTCVRGWLKKSTRWWESSSDKFTCTVDPHPKE
jgi:hypothetical protein